MFATSPTLTTKLFTPAYNWSDLIKPNHKNDEQKIRVRRRGNKIQYYIKPSNSARVREDDIEKFEKQRRKLNWTKFDTYKDYQTRMYVACIDEIG